MLNTPNEKDTLASNDTPQRDAVHREYDKVKAMSVSFLRGSLFNHGFFTTVAYLFAWAIVFVGIIAGLALWSSDPFSPNFGPLIILASCVSASAIGLLAEISRKLSHLKDDTTT